MTIRYLHYRLLVVVVVATAAAATAASCNRAEVPAPIVDNATVAVDDERLATFVQARYQTDSTIRASEISVSADDGVVTLRGTVSDENTRERAVTLARQVEGVRNVDNQLRVATKGPGDAATTSRPSAARSTPRASADSATPGWITTKIQAQYFVNPDLKPWNIDVTTASNGTVTLRGEVDEAAHREEAARIARDTDGVARVDNQLRVRGESTVRATEARGDDAAERSGRDTDSPDTWITAKVQAKYFLDTDVKGRSINVETRDGAVTLRGDVDSEGERRQAVAIARNTDGVKSVTDQLQVVRADTDRADAERADVDDLQARRDAELGIDDVWITTKVQAKFFLDDDIKARDISVDAREGVVYLKGTVESDIQRQVAESIARETDGVSRVENLIKVDSATSRR